MKTLLIIFAVLLLLLTLLSAFGGSISFKEPFYDASMMKKKDDEDGVDASDPTMEMYVDANMSQSVDAVKSAWNTGVHTAQEGLSSMVGLTKTLTGGDGTDVEPFESTDHESSFAPF